MNKVNKILGRMHNVLNSMRRPIQMQETQNDFLNESYVYELSQDRISELILLSSMLNLENLKTHLSLKKHQDLFDEETSQNSIIDLNGQQENYTKDDKDKVIKDSKSELFDDEWDGVIRKEDPEWEALMDERMISLPDEFWDNLRLERDLFNLEMKYPEGVKEGDKNFSARTWSYYFFFLFLNRESTANRQDLKDIMRNPRPYLIKIWGNSHLYNMYIGLDKTKINMKTVKKSVYESHTKSLKEASIILRSKGFHIAASEARLMYEGAVIY